MESQRVQRMIKEIIATEKRRAIEKARRIESRQAGPAKHVEAKHVEAKHVEAKHVEAKPCCDPPKHRFLNNSSCCGPLPANNQVQLESSYLDARMSACPVYLRTPVQPESVRINALIQSTVNAYAPPTDPTRRFLEYEGPFIPPACPPVDPNIFNASQGFRQIICPQPRNYYSGL